MAQLSTAHVGQNAPHVCNEKHVLDRVCLTEMCAFLGMQELGRLATTCYEFGGPTQHDFSDPTDPFSRIEGSARSLLLFLQASPPKFGRGDKSGLRQLALLQSTLKALRGEARRCEVAYEMGMCTLCKDMYAEASGDLYCERCAYEIPKGFCEISNDCFSNGCLKSCWVGIDLYKNAKTRESCVVKLKLKL